MIEEKPLFNHNISMAEKKDNKKKKGRKGVIFFTILLTALSLTSIGLIIYSLIPPQEEKTDLNVLENKIRQINELAVVKQVYRDVIYTKAGTVFTSETLFSIEYSIVAGVDLSRGLSLQGNPETNSVTVTLPQPEIISIDADDMTINQIYIRETFRNLRQSDYMQLIIDEKDVLRQAALEAGILNQARINTEIIIEKILKLSGYNEVRFTYTPISADEETE